jgi:hypothetical protein
VRVLADADVVKTWAMSTSCEVFPISPIYPIYLPNRTSLLELRLVRWMVWKA